MQPKFLNVGRNLKKLRTLHGMSQEEFCKIFGVNQSQYSKFERGVQTLTAKQIVAVCAFFKIPPDYLFVSEDIDKHLKS